ncbi:MAG: SDR family oxidoreductase [Opitutales bacterium]|jgi:enoyl-[acyl-carrier protein] reductase I
MAFLDIAERTYLVTGVANKKSVAWHIAQALEAEGAKVIYSVRSAARKASLEKLLAGRVVLVCDVERPEEIEALGLAAAAHGPFDGLVHSIAWADFSAGPRPFHETRRAEFMQAMGISAFSLVELARAFKPHFKKEASVVAISISSQVTTENYGYMGPVKAALESVARFLAKSFSADSEVRFNTVNAGPLKTSASAGIPGYLDHYLFAEKLTYRKRALETREVADAAVFLLSPRSSGINGQGLVVNAGLDSNYFDREVVRAATRPTAPGDAPSTP